MTIYVSLHCVHLFLKNVSFPFWKHKYMPLKLKSLRTIKIVNFSSEKLTQFEQTGSEAFFYSAGKSKLQRRSWVSHYLQYKNE